MLGVGPGCYLVLPVLGPSTVRDTAGSFANVFGWRCLGIMSTLVIILNILSQRLLYMQQSYLSGIDFRAKNIDSFDNLEKNSMDFYASVRSLYLQDRQNKIKLILMQ